MDVDGYIEKLLKCVPLLEDELDLLCIKVITFSFVYIIEDD